MAIAFKQPSYAEAPVESGREIALSNPSALSVATQRALAERTEKEAARMIPSLAAERAKDSWQAELDAFRMGQAVWVGSAVLESTTNAILRNNAYCQQVAAAHPEVATEVVGMVQDLTALLVQMPRVSVAGYTGRYFRG